MKLAGLFSGGKDSTFAIYKAKTDGNSIECLVTLFPYSEESMLLHYPNIEITKLQAESMKIPHLFENSKSSDTQSEMLQLEKILKQAKQEFSIEGIVHGGLLSNFQREKFCELCKNLELKLLSPLWDMPQYQYMKDLIDSNFHFILISVSADGLNDSWLGKEILESDLERLKELSSKFGFNLNFEGGEAETLVIDCPLFTKPIKIKKSKKIWDGYRGRFEILEAKIDNNA